MTTDLQRQSANTSAKIYEFPARGRFALQRRDNNAALASPASVSRCATAASGSAWYHEEAVEAAIHDEN
ncbi:MAG: DUF2735 domain-containing protein [Pseudolabrys sp.]|nr:DUF2735 domain-containing protein [Pseudolabrys sp.]